jgi:hypothetical protein
MNTLNLTEAKKYIQNIDFSMIIKKMIKGSDWSYEDACTCAQLYKNYLFLVKKYDGQYQLPPSEEIDEFWHNHILDTEKYHTDCQAIFGKYLHHYPYFGIDDKSNTNTLNDSFDVLQELYFKEFGEYL